MEIAIMRRNEPLKVGNLETERVLVLKIWKL
jgi:hypothetical protein